MDLDSGRLNVIHFKLSLHCCSVVLIFLYCACVPPFMHALIHHLVSGPPGANACTSHWVGIRVGAGIDESLPSNADGLAEEVNQC